MPECGKLENPKKKIVKTARIQIKKITLILEYNLIVNIFWILTLATVTGQLIKIPIGTQGGITLLDIAILGLCLLGLFRLRLHLKKPPLFILIALLFILIALFSLVFTPLHLNTQEIFISFSYIIRFSVYILLGWLIYSGAFPKLNSRIPKLMIFSGVGLAILGLLQFIFLPDLRFLTLWGFDPHYFRTVSTFFDPNFAGAFFVLTLLFLLFHLGGGPDRTPKVFALIFTLVYLTLLTTFSRSSYLMFLASGLILSVLKKSKKLALLVITLFTGLMLVFYVYTKTISSPRNIDRTKSATSRLNTWQQGWTLFQNHPLFGAGFNAYRFAIREYNLGDEQFLKSHGSGSNDSSLLFVAATSGILGFAGYTFFLFSLLKHAWRKNPLLIAGLSGLMIHSFFANSLFFPPILLWIILTAISKK